MLDWITRKIYSTSVMHTCKSCNIYTDASDIYSTHISRPYLQFAVQSPRVSLQMQNSTDQLSKCRSRLHGSDWDIQNHSNMESGSVVFQISTWTTFGILNFLKPRGGVCVTGQRAQGFSDVKKSWLKSVWCISWSLAHTDSLRFREALRGHSKLQDAAGALLQYSVWNPNRGNQGLTMVILVHTSHGNQMPSD